MKNLEENSCGICSGVGSFKVRRTEGTWDNEPCPCAKDNQELAIRMQLAQDRSRLLELEQEIASIQKRVADNIDRLSTLQTRH